ncbi:MAG: amino acid permease [Bacteroidales bacterium]|nr:amino acid permease [Bacteroidales bacterium]
MNSNLFRKKSIHDSINESMNSSLPSLKKTLNVFDLTSLGIAAIIGAGIFSTIGTAAYHGGPAVSLLFIFTALACGFSAMCYARFASSIPVSGSAYTYAYVSFGELIAWIIGWDLIMEYAVGNIAVAISWSDYFTALLRGLSIHIPEYLSVDFLTASRGYEEVVRLVNEGYSFHSLSYGLKEAYFAYTNAPEILGVKFIADIPAFSIVAIIATLVFIGIQESKIAGDLMVILKVLILLMVITVGAFYVNPSNWSPFAPNGFAGVMKGVAGVFFAYIGFDAISTTAEECKNPQRDLPKGMILALLITTLLYVFTSLVLTGMVNYKELGVGDPLAYAFEKYGLTEFSGIIAFSAVIAMAGVLLVFQVGQPRIWMVMSRDGLLPPRFSYIHKRFRTPYFATLISGIFVAIPSLFMNLTEVTDLTSIGTLFAFVLVSGGVILMDEKKSTHKLNGKFKIFYINSRYAIPVSWALFVIILLILNISVNDIQRFLTIPHLIFMGVAILVSILSVKREWSFIPVLSLLINLYLMAELGTTNWLRFFIWLALGLVIYFAYGIRKSKLNQTATGPFMGG